MKKLLLALVLASTIAQAQTVITPHGDTVTIKGYIAPPVISPPVVTPPTSTALNVPNNQEKKFDYMYTAYGSTVDKNGAVTLIPELLTGKYPIKYRGNLVPAITGIPPVLTKDSKFIEFLNRPNTSFASDNLPAPLTSFDVWLVSYNDFGQPYEVKLPGGGGSPYIGDNDSGVRVLHPAYDAGVAKLPNYKMSIERIVYKDGTGYYYQDGILKSTIKVKAEDLPITRTYNGIGVETNNKDWHFAALYVKAGVLSDSDAQAIQTNLATKWNAGSYPNEALINKITWLRTGDVNKAGTTWTPGVEYQNIPAGIVLAPFSEFKFEWFYNTDNFRKQVTFSTKQIITKADFPTGWDKLGGFSIGLRITPKYKDGTYGLKFNGKQGDYARTDMW